ncbi:TIGR04338 family metallohydrolase [Williamsia deligens]|uniref:TIGR04338 family metallohydrolase n=1 Tax=Williamsia deligens TaxID=321325 RepID=A0ABW3G372_9NOCA|nr:TIGR04338 family metallohydrolase [Williamsia deligens]
MGTDRGREALYAAERMAHLVFEAPGTGAQIGGVPVTVPPEARFGSVESVAAHVERVLARPSVRERFPRAVEPVVVRARRGPRSAHYEAGPPAVIAVPEDREGRWALRELVVLHELAHHLDDSGGAAHGPAFATTLIDLVADVVGPEAGWIYRVLFTESDVPIG